MFSRLIACSWLIIFDETKRNETKRNETKRNETKRNETKRNETKRNEKKRKEKKRKVIFKETNETSSISHKPLARSNRNHDIRVGGIDFHLREWFLKETCPSEMNFEKF